MATSPPASPSSQSSRPMSAIVRPAPRSTSRLSTYSKTGGSRASDEDGKTSVKVAVRVRPPLQPDDPGYELIPQRFQRSMIHVNSPTNLSIDSPQGRKLFVFDHVFGEDVAQDGIWEYLTDSVSAFVQGYNVSMLAYGQSGAGKSYTMGTSGPLDQKDYAAMGVIPRAAKALFEKLEGKAPGASNRNSMSGIRTPTRYSMQPGLLSSGKPAERKAWVLKASYVEIYNEQLRDLLIPDNVPLSERAQVTIREDIKGNILLTGLRQVEINSVEDLMGVLNFGSSIRQTDATAINAKSSRSHAVFSLNLVQRTSKAPPQGAEKRFSVPLEALTGADATVTIDSKLHFVDLAGSERLKNTGAQGERAKEGISINAGLASLGKVISQLSSRQAGAHVSYRDSKLTRLLQDSLGGNAITYMIACVTPAEFHLSETLNTVQYAQRARAIQSKPRIQQVSDESDKQAVIDRLKAEVAFLREQIRSTERTGERRLAANERPERPSEREMDLQNQLLDVQENYTTLSQRHANLISEIAKARDGERAENQAREELGDAASERLKRSKSYAEAVEQVVLEYEKTIQSLEQSLSSTRSSLSTTEATLLERETKCAYTDTLNQQLQNRVQKLMDREGSTESYLRDLEAKLDTQTSGEEKNSVIVAELRKELARVRESEAGCEDYISTLEERLAEADQDSELMQREIERLEHVIERQRSLGKLDSLLYELDNIQNASQRATPTPTNNNERDLAAHSRKSSIASRRSRKGTVNTLNGDFSRAEDIPEVEEPPTPRPHRTAEEGPMDYGESIEEEEPLDVVPEELTEDADEAEIPEATTEEIQSIDQASEPDLPSEKVESIPQELLELREAHAATVADYENLSAKYEEAMRALADLQDAMDEAKHTTAQNSLPIPSPTESRPVSFLADQRVTELKDANNYSSSRSLSSELSSELSSAGDSTLNIESSEADGVESSTDTEDTSSIETKVAIVNGASADSPHSEKFAIDDTAAEEVEALKKLAEQKEAAEQKLREKYEQLEEQHLEALDLVEELKTEVSKAKMNGTHTSRASTSLIRRKSSQNLLVIDRAHRSFAALRNIAAENFESQPDVMQNFEVNLNAAMHELHARSERVQELETDIAAVRKEMDAKTTIISGLARERSSMKSGSPMDVSVVAKMQEELLRNENVISQMTATHDSRERELQDRVASLNTLLDEHSASRDAHQDIVASQKQLLEDQNKKISEIEAELQTLQDRHQNALESMQTSEQQLRGTIIELETRLAASLDAAAAADLHHELEEQKKAIATHLKSISELESAHAATKNDLDAANKAMDANREVIDQHVDQVSHLTQLLKEHEDVIKQHEGQIDSLRQAHEQELDELKTAAVEEQNGFLSKEHEHSIQILESELSDARDDLKKIATQIAFALGVEVSVESIEERVNELLTDRKLLSETQIKTNEFEKHVLDLTNINDTILAELDGAKTGISGLLGQYAPKFSSKGNVTDDLNALKKEMEELDAKNKKHSRLVGELEDQLAQNFDQHQIANNRLSTLQTERHQQLEEARAATMRVQTDLDAMREAYSSLQAKYEDATPKESASPKRTSSINSNLRKSASVASLPSPPPAIPLPPLPGNAAAPSGTSTPVPPAPTVGTRPPSNEAAAAQIQQDQEARIEAIQKHLNLEKQLTASLELALDDLEAQSKKSKTDCEAWRRRASELEAEVRELKERPAKEERWSVHAVEEERKKRLDAEMARRQLEERMNTINKKKKKSSLNCF